MNDERFSKRHGYGPEEAAILIRDHAPEEVRGGILSIAKGELELQPSFLRYALCTVLRKIPDQANWSEYPNIWGNVSNLSRMHLGTEFMILSKLSIKSWKNHRGLNAQRNGLNSSMNTSWKQV